MIGGGEGCEAVSLFRTTIVFLWTFPTTHAKVCGISIGGKEGGTREGRGIINWGYRVFRVVYIAPSSFNFEIIPSTSATLPPPCRGGGSEQ